MTFESSHREPQIEPRWSGRKDKRARTPIANGTRLIMADGRSLWAKRFTEICSAHCADLGGFDNLSQAELAIIKRAATLQVELEALETRLANGEGKIDLVAFAQISNGMRRLLETVGIRRRPRDCTPNLAEIVASHHNDAEMIDARAEQSRVDEMVEQGCDTRAEESSVEEDTP
ncbi:MAG: hypothetical protein ACR652_25125 [Methylocystis sp.]|uniref:hypothetical protein n=1 Tax=Methylocystis sp. TaxID=1911079 RepID=UPI003DA44B83